ncbi:hypothetical protein PVAND_009655 [Polypedilum vanderplanki]|uniref:Uncharacterized protein n=1 Tax=Polypedilum vanderplanki TaxID=319348 RepID=A0A9J6CDJ2_POLVA|nr:hypothetical protein PVAND_009655 [Polypedilum vanderplanki]
MQLKNYSVGSSQEQKKSMFSIPKLLFNKKENAQISENKKTAIDLTSALIPEKERIELSKVIQQQSQVEVVDNFIPQFIDCEDTVNVSNSKPIDFGECCERITLRELRQNCKEAHLANFSMIGKILRKKYRKKIPYIQHAYAKHTINQFKFDTPSPDDQILAHLSKKKK